MPTPFLALFLCWLLGLWVGERTTAGTLFWGGASLLPCLWLGYSLRYRHPHPLYFQPTLYLPTLVLFFLLGALRATVAQQPGDAVALSYYNESQQVQIVGIVAEYPELYGTTARYRIRATELQAADGIHTVQGDLLVTLPRYPTFRYGDRLLLEGDLRTPPAPPIGFDYRTYLARQNIHSLMHNGQATVVREADSATFWSALYALRDKAAATIAVLLPEPHAALLAGILLGIESGIPDEVMEQFNITGTTHVLVISGANFAVIIAILVAVGTQLGGRRWPIGLALVGIPLYAALVGGSPPVLRAALMGAVVLFAQLTRNRTTGLNSLAVALWMITLVDPDQYYDVGYQLSALATAGLILLAPPLTTLLTDSISRFAPRLATIGVIQALISTLALTLAAQLMTLPLIVSTFGRLSLVALLANVLIGPVQALILGAGLLATAVAMILPPLGHLIALLPYAALSWTLAVVTTTAQFPYAALTVGPFSPNLIWLIYGSAGLLTWLIRLPQSRQPMSLAPSYAPTRPAMYFCILLLVIPLLGGWLWQQRPDGNLHLYVLNVGQGDALLIVTPDGKQILIDGGPDPAALLPALSQRMPPWDKTLDLVILTHPDADHLGGLPELFARYTVASVIDSGQPHEGSLYAAYQAALIAERQQPLAAQPSHQIALGGGATLTVLAPRGDPFAQSNNNSVIIELRYGTFCALLTGDIEQPAEEQLLADNALSPCPILKVAHHGSDTSTSEAVLNVVQPQYALISAGADNRFNHPSPIILERLQAHNIRIFRTDLQGTIHLFSDGQTIWAETER